MASERSDARRQLYEGWPYERLGGRVVDRTLCHGRCPRLRAAGRQGYGTHCSPEKSAPLHHDDHLPANPRILEKSSTASVVSPLFVTVQRMTVFGAKLSCAEIKNYEITA